jgi:hypothetical protein
VFTSVYRRENIDGTELRLKIKGTRKRTENGNGKNII